MTTKPSSSRLIRGSDLRAGSRPSSSSRGSDDAASFAPFGDIIQNPSTHDGFPSDLTRTSANQATAAVLHDITRMQNHYNLALSRKPAEIKINLFVCQPRPLTIDHAVAVSVLERHPYTPQTFIPLGVAASDPDARYLVVVAPTLPATSRRASNETEADPRVPPYPTDRPQPSHRRRRSLKDRLLRARPNPFTNDFDATTTPDPNPRRGSSSRPKGPGQPDLDNLRAFVLSGAQAVTYAAGTWHSPMLALGNHPIEFVVVQYANGVAAEDCQEVLLQTEDGQGGIRVDVRQDRANTKAKL